MFTRSDHAPAEPVPRLQPVGGREAPVADHRAAAALPGAHRRAASLICVLPCFNEARNLDGLLPRLFRRLGALVEAREIVPVDDSSTDETARTLGRSAPCEGVRALPRSRNLGKEAALTAGLELARSDVVTLMDADLQREPGFIPKLLGRWRDRADMVYTLRRDRRSENWFKRLGTRGFCPLVNGAGRFEVPPGAGDFRLMDRQVIAALLALPERSRFMKGLYAWAGFDAVAVPYTPAPRASGRSHFGALRLLALSLDGLTAFTTWALRAVSLVGLTLAVAALLYGACLTLSYLLYGHAVSEWTTIVVSLMLFVGIELISLGIVGEHLGRVFEKVKGRLLFVVKGELGCGLPSPRR